MQQDSLVHGNKKVSSPVFPSLIRARTQEDTIKKQSRFNIGSVLTRSCDNSVSFSQLLLCLFGKAFQWCSALRTDVPRPL